MSSLLIDKLLTEPISGVMPGSMVERLGASQVFLIENIKTAMPDPLDYAALPALTPPYSDCWFEWGFASNPNPDVFLDMDGNLSERMMDLIMLGTGQGYEGAHVYSSRTDDGWLLRIHYGAQTGRVSPMFLPYFHVVTLDAQGRFVEIDRFGVPDAVDYPQEILAALQDVQDEMRVTDIVLYALGLLNCKNVVTVERGGPPLAGRRSRRKGWLRRHRVLQVQPMRQIRKIERDDTPGDAGMSPRSFHFCRGHFKHYTAARPLFGRHVGSYWWDAQARGSLKSGIVTKDYALDPPGEV
jgi:hypothetical protein